MVKNQKGITLIALVITIIVLLILAGVTIAMLTGENGILNQATTARDTNTKAEIEERINIELNAMYSKALAGSASFEFDTTSDKAQIEANLGTGYTVEVETNSVTITAPANSGLTTATGSVTVDNTKTGAERVKLIQVKQ